MNREGKYIFTKSEAMLVDSVAVQSSHAQLDTRLNTASALKALLGSSKIRSPFEARDNGVGCVRCLNPFSSRRDVDEAINRDRANKLQTAATLRSPFPPQ